MADQKFVANSVLTNTTVSSIVRPTRDGPGGDITASPEQLPGGDSVLAIREPGERLVRSPDGRTLTVDATFYLDLTNAEGRAIDVAVGDILTWESYEGALSGSGAEVLARNVYRSPGLSRTNHIELLTRG